VRHHPQGWASIRIEPPILPEYLNRAVILENPYVAVALRRIDAGADCEISQNFAVVGAHDD
jgi:hypothetical protein